VLPVSHEGISTNPGLLFPLKPESPLDGILSHLTRKHGGNVHDLNIVRITANSLFMNVANYAAKNVADLMADTSFWSTNEENRWICFDFLNLKIRPTHYSIRSNHGGCINSSNLKSWVIESSDDAVGWTVIDRRENNDSLNEKNAIGTFTIAHSVNCRYIRLRQTGKNHYGSHSLIISSFEFFGSLIE
jgi:hypothetical protein